MKCQICKKNFRHPVQRGRKPHFCPKCRVARRKKWRKAYDAQDHIKAAKRKRELPKRYRAMLEKAIRNKQRAREALAKLGL